MPPLKAGEFKPRVEVMSEAEVRLRALEEKAKLLAFPLATPVKNSHIPPKKLKSHVAIYQTPDQTEGQFTRAWLEGREGLDDSNQPNDKDQLNLITDSAFFRDGELVVDHNSRTLQVSFDYAASDALSVLSARTNYLVMPAEQRIEFMESVIDTIRLIDEAPRQENQFD